MKIYLNLFVLSLLLGLSQRIALGDGEVHLPGKFYVSSVTGTVECIADDKIFDLRKGDAVLGRGAILKSSKGSNATIVFSNETTFFVDENTDFKINKFEQQPFQPNNNLVIEPSNSSTLVTVTTGRIVISTPQLQSGTKLIFETAHAQVNLLNDQSGGEQGVIEVNEKQTHFALVSGAASIRPRAADGEFVSIGTRLKSTQQAFVRYTITGQLELSEDAEVAAVPGGSPAVAATAPQKSPAAPGAPPPPSPAAAAPEGFSADAPISISPGMAVVLKVTGNVNGQTSEVSRETPLVVGARLPQGTIITTGDTGEAYVQPFDGAIATIRPNSKVVLEKLALATANGVIQKQTALLALKKGMLVSTIDPAKRKINNYAVRTPNGIATAQGTSFSISVTDDNFSIAATADTVSFVTASGTSYAITAGNITITPAGGQPQPPIPLAQAVRDNPAVGRAMQIAVNTVSAIVQNNIGNLPSASAVNLISQVVGVATVAMPRDATAFSTEVVTAVNSPGASTAGNAASATASVTSASVTAAPSQASQIAGANAKAAPSQANTVAASAASADPAQASKVAAAVMQTISDSTGKVSLTAMTQAASSLAAAVATSVPGQSGQITGALMQMITQANPQAGTTATTQAGATLASATASAVPSQAAPIAAAVMSTITQQNGTGQNTALAMAQTAATLAAAVTTTAPTQAVPVATALMQFVNQNSTAAESASASGLLAAAISQASPSAGSAVTAAVAAASNQSVATVTQSAQQATVQATQTLQTASQSVASGAQAAQTAVQSTTAVTSSSAEAAADVIATATSKSTTPSATTTNVVQATSVIVTTLNAGQLTAISNILTTAQNAQSTVTFNTDTGTNTVTATPTTPTNLPVQNVVSPASI